VLPKEVVEVGRRDPPTAADIEGAQFTVPDPVPNRGIADPERIGDIIRGQKLFYYKSISGDMISIK